MAAGIYYVVFTFYNSADNLNAGLAGAGSPAHQHRLADYLAAGDVSANAAGMTVYVGTVSGAETAQGNSTAAAEHSCRTRRQSPRQSRFPR